MAEVNETDQEGQTPTTVPAVPVNPAEALPLAEPGHQVDPTKRPIVERLIAHLQGKPAGETPPPAPVSPEEPQK